MAVPPLLPKEATLPPEPFPGFDGMVEDELLAVDVPATEPTAPIESTLQPQQREVPQPVQRLVVEFSPGNIFVATCANLAACLLFAVVIWISLSAWFHVPAK